jgi:hypothetical protein
MESGRGNLDMSQGVRLLRRPDEIGMKSGLLAMTGNSNQKRTLPHKKIQDIKNT